MENKNESNGFQYTYSAAEQEELKRIRDKYAPKEEGKMERLLRLDRGVTRKAQTVSLIFGILGALILGFGMSMCMTDLGNMLVHSRSFALYIGIIVGSIGAIFVCLAYPMYNLVIKRERKKLAPEIIRLTDELMK